MPPLDAASVAGLFADQSRVVEAGAKRISVGGALTWTAVNATVAAARAIRDRGDFSQFGPEPSLDEWFAPGA
jgi:hypothetical protein